MVSNSAEFTQEPNLNPEWRWSVLESQIKRVEKDVKFLMHRLELQDQSTSICCTYTCQTEKKRLSSELEAANILIRELQAKVNCLEVEKSSLVTAIKIIQEDNSNAPVTNQNANLKENVQNNSSLIKVRKNRSKIKDERCKATRKLPENTTLMEPRHDSLEENGPTEQNPSPQMDNPTLDDEHPNTSKTSPTRSNVIIAGDSMVKHLDGFKMSKTDTRVKISTFPGCTTLDMADYIRPILRKNPQKLILHVGTNSLKGRETSFRSMEAENLEYFLLGDLNVDLLPTATSPNRAKLVEMFDIYDLEQLINELTRITAKSSTLIYLCITSAPINVVNSGVMHLSISDHSLVYMIGKAHYVQDGVRHIEARTMKNISTENFLRDLEQKHWNNISYFEDPNKMWEIWKCKLMEVIDKHAPLRSRRISNRKSPWITNDLRREIFNRDYLKKKAVSSNNPDAWDQYRQIRKIPSQ